MFDAARENDIAKRPEWYQAVLKEIEALEHPKPKDSESHSGSQVQYSFRLPPPDEIDDWLMEHWQASFQSALLEMINKRGMSYTEFYKAAWMDRKLFSAIKNNPQYQPKKETAIACCLALKLRRPQVTKLLRLAGYALSPANQRDLIIDYCIRNEIWDIDVVNNILYLKSMPPIMSG